MGGESPLPSALGWSVVLTVGQLCPIIPQDNIVVKQLTRILPRACPGLEPPMLHRYLHNDILLQHWWIVLNFSCFRHCTVCTVLYTCLYIPQYCSNYISTMPGMCVSWQYQESLHLGYLVEWFVLCISFLKNGLANVLLRLYTHILFPAVRWSVLSGTYEAAIMNNVI